MLTTDDLGSYLPQIWESWRHPLQAAEFTGWYLLVFVVPYQGSLRAVVLDREVGAAGFQVGTLIQACSYCLMTKHVFNIDVGGSRHSGLCVLELPHVVREVWLRPWAVVTWSACPREWSACVLTFRASAEERQRRQCWQSSSPVSKGLFLGVDPYSAGEDDVASHREGDGSTLNPQPQSERKRVQSSPPGRLQVAD